MSQFDFLKSVIESKPQYPIIFITGGYEFKNDGKQLYVHKIYGWRPISANGFKKLLGKNNMMVQYLNQLEDANH